MQRKNWPLLLSAILVLGAVALGSHGAQAKDNPPHQISVAMGEDYPPFYYVDDKGQAAGWLADVWRLWSRKTGIKVRFVLAPFGQTLKMVGSGKVRVHGGCFRNQERAAYLDFVAPVAKTTTSYFFHESLLGVHGLKDLPPFRIGVIQGDYAQDYLRKKLPKATLVPFATHAELFQAVKKGSLRVFISDTPVGLHFLNQMDMANRFRYFPEQPLYSETFYASVKKGDQALAQVIAKGFKRISEAETGVIAKRWMGLKWQEGEDFLRIACDRDYPPFTWLTDTGRPAGIFIDLWRLWAAMTGAQVEFVFGTGSDCLDYLKSGRADIHSGLLRAYSREAWIDYSLPLFPAEINLFYPAQNQAPDLDKLAGMRIGVLGGTVVDELLRDKLSQARLVPFTTFSQMLPALARGELQAVVDVGLAVSFALRRLGLAGQVSRHPQPLGVKDMLAGVPSNRKELLDKINQGLGLIPKERIVQIEERWVPDPQMRRYQKLLAEFRLTPAERRWLAGHPEIRLGVDPDWLPLEGLSPEGELLGLSSGYADVLSKMLGVKMRPVVGRSWAEILEAAQAREVDLLPCLASSPERAKYLTFTRPYLDFASVLVTRKDQGTLTGLIDLKGRKLAVVQGFAIHGFVKKKYPEIKLVTVESPSQGLLAVEEGEAQAYADNLYTCEYYLRKLGLKGLGVTATTEFTTHLAMGVRKDWPELVGILEKALQSLTPRQRADIANHWFNIQFDRRIDWSFVVRAVGIAGLLALLLILGFAIWNRRLAAEAERRRQAEELFKDMAENVPGSIFRIRVLKGGDWEYIFLSKKAEKFFGAPSDTVIKKRMLLDIHPEDRQRANQDFQEAFGQETVLNSVFRIKTAKADLKWVRISGSPFRSPQGELIYNGFVLDITERKLAEQEYLAAERKVMAMSQAVEDALVMLDGTGKVLFWNPAAERMFGYRQDEALGMDFHSMAAPSEDLETIRKGLENFGRTGQGSVLGRTTELIARNRQGEPFPVEVTLSAFQMDEDWYAVGTVRDISERKKAEEALRASQEQFRIIADYTYDWEGWHDAQGKLLWVNPGVERISGYQVAECMKMEDYPLHLLHPDDHESWRQSLALALTGEEGNDVPFRVVTKKGQQVWVALSWNPVFDQEGTFTGFRTSARDFTERKEAQEALAEREAYMNKILATSQEGFWFIDNDGYTKDVNQALCDILGRPKEQILGKHVFEFYDQENLAILKRQLEQREQLEENTYEISLNRPDGTQVPCQFNATPFLDDAGNKIGSFAMVSDITERKKAELRIKESEERVRQILVSAGEGVFGVDSQGRLSFINPAALSFLGFAEEELMGRDVHEMFHHSRADGSVYPAQECPMNASFTEGAEHHVEDEVLWRKDGSSFPVEYASHPIRKGDAVLGAVVTFRDISERKQVEEEMRRYIDDLERFNRLTVEREERMIQLKEEINLLLARTGQERKYKIVDQIQEH